VNGLSNQVECGVCYTNSIRINGMEGPYTSVLIDGMPLMSALASVYGLNGINPALLERVEVVKGPASTLYGSEAMAGVVNVITKDPRFAPRLALDASLTSHGEGNLDVGAVAGSGHVAAMLGLNVAYNDRFLDGNADGFSDIPLNRRAVLFGKLDAAPGGRRSGGVQVKYLWEDRAGGVEAFGHALRGSGEVYGESVYTRRLEAVGSWTPALPGARVEGSYTWHDQDSWYGDSRYAAVQHVAAANLLWTRSAGRHDVLIGASVRYQTYDDQTPATVEPERRLIPGVFVEDEVTLGSALALLGGVRADHHAEHGAILSPRFAGKWEVTEHTAVRLNAGTGFRVVHLFTEDHAALTGTREVVIAERLAPERSRSVSLNLNQVVELGPNPMMIDLDLFHTRFSNRILPDYDRDPSLIVYENLAGHAVSRGVSLSLNQNVDFDRLLYTLGVTLQDVYTVRAGAREAEFFAPSVRAVASATWTSRSLPLRVEYAASATGPMRLPAYEPPHERPTRSPTYSLHNLQGAWRFGGGFEVYLSVKNLFDYTQASALVDPANPFGEAFDTAWIYGPLRGRHLMLGFRHGVAR
jgi:outer membrane receptor for ferrienterochelin and colicins